MRELQLLQARRAASQEMDARRTVREKVQDGETQSAGRLEKEELALLLLRCDDVGLVGKLRALPPELRLGALLALARLTGPARAAQLFARAGVAGGIPSPPPAPAASELEPSAALGLAQARALEECLRGAGVRPLRRLLRGLLSGFPPHVRKLALERLASHPLAGEARVARRHEVRRGDDGAGRALAAAVERRAVMILRRALPGAATLDHPAVAEALDRAGAGAPLPDEVRRELETELRADFGRVRIHVDPVAAAAAGALAARAFTLGEDIFFAAGCYDPSSAGGRRLLIHELTHVVQAQQGRTAGTGRVSNPDDPLEREAEARSEATPAAPRDAPAPASTPASRDAPAPASTPAPRDASAPASSAGPRNASAPASATVMRSTDETPAPNPEPDATPAAKIQPVMKCYAAAQVYDDSHAPRSGTKVPKGTSVRVLFTAVWDEMDSPRTFARIAQLTGPDDPSTTPLGWIRLTDATPGAPPRPPRPSTAATQMANVLSVALRDHAAHAHSHCYGYVKNYILNAGGYGDLLDLYHDDRFADFSTAAIDFDAAVGEDPASFGLEKVSVTPAEAPPGSILITQGTAQMSGISTEYGDIAIIVGTGGGGEGSDEVRRVPKKSTAWLRDADGNVVMDGDAHKCITSDYVWLLEPTRSVTIDGKAMELAHVAQVDEPTATEPGADLGWTSARNLSSVSKSSKYLIVINDAMTGASNAWPGTPDGWTSGRWAGVCKAIYKPIDRT